MYDNPCLVSHVNFNVPHHVNNLCNSACFQSVSFYRPDTSYGLGWVSEGYSLTMPGVSTYCNKNLYKHLQALIVRLICGVMGVEPPKNLQVL